MRNGVLDISFFPKGQLRAKNFVFDHLVVTGTLATLSGEEKNILEYDRPSPVDVQQGFGI